jgi:hypothetical protein
VEIIDIIGAIVSAYAVISRNPYIVVVVLVEIVDLLVRKFAQDTLL